MCYSAMVEQDFKNLGLRKGDWIEYSLFRDLFKRRLDGQSIYLTKAMEQNFLDGDTLIEREISDLILKYRKSKISEEEGKLFGFKKRLNEARGKLQVKETKSALKEIEVCERQIERTQTRLESLTSKGLVDEDSRIFPMGWAPMLTSTEKGRRVVPARYHLRPRGQSPDFDSKYNGNYNARRENLLKVNWWKDLYGRNHGIFKIHRFYENVPRHLFEHRELRPNEKAENLVLEFIPSDGLPLFVTVLYDVWPSREALEFYSMAAITMDPPPEIAETGHQRCIVPIPESEIDSWLRPGQAFEVYDKILDLRRLPFYKHRLAA